MSIKVIDVKYTLAGALLEAQKQMGSALKGSSNPFYKSKYADLNSIREAVIPVLNAVGISVLQPMIHVDGRNFVKTTLLHESGTEYSSLTEIICAKPNDPQAQGSAISYARRYGLQALPCVGAEDDDGEGAMDREEVTNPAAAKVRTRILNYKDDAIAKAQVAVAKKTVTKTELLKQLAAKSDSITDAVNELSLGELAKFLTFIESKIK